MARELNRDLFRIQPQSTSPGPSPAGPGAPAKAEDVRTLFLQFEAMAKKINEIQSRLEKITAQTDDVVKQNKQRFERVQGHFQRQNEMFQNGLQDVNQRMAQIVSRVNERKVEDGVVKEMVERHAHVVQSFEVRMQQLQRLIGEQELQLINARAELKDALHELARLKKL